MVAKGLYLGIAFAILVLTLIIPVSSYSGYAAKTKKFTVTTAIEPVDSDSPKAKIIVKLNTGEKQTKKVSLSMLSGEQDDDRVFVYWTFKTKKSPKWFDGYLTFGNFYEHEGGDVAGKFDSHRHGFVKFWID